MTNDRIGSQTTPNDYIAIAVRTDYNRKTLRGKGFIYFSADSGPLRYKGEHLMDSGWSVGGGGPLFHVLTHELGHVFGIPHVGSSESLSLMGHGYPGFALLDLGAGMDPLDERTIFNFFKPAPQIYAYTEAGEMFCMPSNTQRYLRGILRFLFLDESLRCLRVAVHETEAVVHYSQFPGGEEILAGSVTFIQDPRKQFEVEQFVGQLAISEDQEVFDDLSLTMQILGVINGAVASEFHRTGFYRDVESGRSRLVQIVVNPRTVRVGGMYEGALVPDAIRLGAF